MNKVNQNLRERDEHGYTSLHREIIIMALWGSTNPAKTLAHIESLIAQDPGLLDIPDKKGLKPLCHAKKYGHSQLIEKLTPQEDKAVAEELVASIVEEVNEIPQEQPLQAKPVADVSDIKAEVLQEEPLPENVSDIKDEVPQEEPLPEAISDIKDEIPQEESLPEAVIVQVETKGNKTLELVNSALEKATELKVEAKESATFLVQMAKEARYTKLHKFIKEGASFEDIKYHIDQGLCDVDERTPTLSTSLHLAAKYGRVDVAHYLLENGADPSFKNLVGNTPLHTAVKYGHQEVIKCLLVAGADPDSVDVLGPLGRSPKDMAKANPELYKLFESQSDVEQGSNGTYHEDMHENALHKPTDEEFPWSDNY